jgi:hypothetical protein
VARFKAETGKELDWNGDVTVEIIVETMMQQSSQIL